MDWIIELLLKVVKVPFMRGTVEYFLRTTINKEIERRFKAMLKITNLDINFEDRRVDMKVLLKGEENIIELGFNYEIWTSDDSGYVKLKNVYVSREWLDILLTKIVLPQAFEDGKIKIPKDVAEKLEQLG
jgi:hypothetical protein